MKNEFMKLTIVASIQIFCVSTFLGLPPQQKPAPPKIPMNTTSSTAPTLTSDQKAALSDGLLNLIEAQSQLEHIPGYAELSAKVQAAQKRLYELQQGVCKPVGGKQYQLDRTVDPKTNQTEWSCKEVPAAKK